MLAAVPHCPDQPLLEAAFTIERCVARLREKVREFYFAVVLFQRPCTRCGATGLVMVRDSWCRCAACGHELDPTEAFQSCPECDGRLAKRICHYWCPACRKPVKSHFCFDARVFNADYFREMMRESRARKEAKVEEMRKLLAESRSQPFQPCDDITEALPDFTAALDQYAEAPILLAEGPGRQSVRFDMPTYRQHILELVQGCVVEFDGISALTEDRRLDRVFRFITVIFMEQDGILDIAQDHAGRIRLWGRR